MGPVEQNEMYSSATSHTHIRMTAHALNTPPVGTPPRSATPPPQAEKRKSDRKTTEEGVRSGADAIDPNALNKALMKEFDDAGRHRDITPGGSPSRKRQRLYGDR
jgi:cell division cycle 20-like protein 1 (cofactor of APC complex)